MAILVMTAGTVSAVTGTDTIGDVYNGALEAYVSKPNIDIIKMTYELSGNTATLTMTVNGSIMDSGYIIYSITLSNNTDLSSGYTMQYNNGAGYVLKVKDLKKVDSEVSVSQGNTIIVTFTLSEGESADFNLFCGKTIEHSEGPTDERSVDYAPNDYPSTWYGGDEDDDVEPDGDGEDENTTGDDEDLILPNGDDTGGDGDGGNGGGIPGFEAVAIIAAIAVALIILRRKK